MNRILTIALAFFLASCSSMGSVILLGPGNPSAPKQCSELSQSARTRASNASIYGWTLSILGYGSATAGVIIPLAVDNDGGLSTREKIAAASFTAGGVALVTLARALFARSDAASKLAGEAALAISEESQEIKIGQRCNRALAAWETSRADASEMANTILQQARKDTGEAKIEAKEQRQQKEDARKELNVERGLNPDGTPIVP
jgi:hypothetical protein